MDVPEKLIANPGNSGRAQFIPIALMGTVMGCALFLCLLMPVRHALVGVAAILAPLLALAFGKWKEFFLAALILGVPIQVKKTIYGYSATHIGGPGGADLLLADCALVALLMHWLFTAAIQKERRIFRFTGFDFCVVCLIFLSTLSVLTTSDMTLTWVDLVRMLKVSVLYFYLANNIRSIKECKYVIFLLLLGVFIHSAVTAVQYRLGRPLGLNLFGEVLEFGQMTFGSSSFKRPSGLMQSANTSALYIVSILPFAVIPLFWLKDWRVRASCVLVFLAGLFTLLITFSRGGWVGFAFAVPVFIYLSMKRGLIKFNYRRHYHMLLGLGAAGFISFLFFSRKIIDRLFHTPSMTTHTRTFLSKLAVVLFASHPFVGVGLNNFAESGERSVRTIPDPHDIYPFVSENPMVHNLYLLTLAETGIFSLVLLLVILFLLYKMGRELMRSEAPVLSSFGVALIAFLVGFAVTEMFDFSYRLDQEFYLFWALSGFTVALTRLERSTRAQSAQTGASG